MRAVSLFATWKLCPRTQVSLCLYLVIGFQCRDVKFPSKYVSVYELGKQFPLEMVKVLGNYLYNELERQPLVRSIQVKQGNL